MCATAVQSHAASDKKARRASTRRAPRFLAARLSRYDFMQV
jgi:hypothetical protein